MESVRPHSLGFTALSDVVAPSAVALFGGGGFDTFCPLGPWIQTALLESPELEAAVARAGEVLTLYPGDVVALPIGAGVSVTAGDRIRTELKGLGVLESLVSESGVSDD